MIRSKGTKVLVLGGTGAMGSYLVGELLNLGYEIVVTSRKERLSNEKNLTYVQGNAKDDVFLSGLMLGDNYDAVVDFMLYTTEEFKHRYELFLENTSQYLFLSSYRVYAESKKQRLSEEYPRLLDTLGDEQYLKTDEYALAKARQEDLLKSSKRKNWTILRPAITYSADRFFFGSSGTDGFLYRALNRKPVIFPKEILDKETTMTWAGDAAKMIALLIGNKKALGEVINISTSEHHSWRQIVDYYREFLGMKVKVIPAAVYTDVYKLKYMMKYNRMYHRMIDNTKVLSLTGMSQDDLMPLSNGLRMELASFSRSPKYVDIDKEREKKVDQLTTTQLQKARQRLMPGTRLRQIKSLAMSKIKYDGAIVTLTVYNNYGNVIQRYALQRFLAMHGYKFIMFDLHTPSVNKHHAKLKKFADKYLLQVPFNPRLAKYHKKYIVGSDQVWRNFSVNKRWDKFGIQFLDFVTSKKAKRISYAASFGVDTLEKAEITDELKAKIKPLIKRFDAISVREKQACEMVEQLGGRKSTQTLDPTLLLPASEYSRLIKQSDYSNKDSSAVFYYLIDPTPVIESAIKHYEGVANAKADGILPYLGPYRRVSLPPMEKWLKAIRDADIVITDSYHAIVFSIIFHTDFVVFDKKGGGLARIAELLDPLGLSDRIVIQGSKKKYTAKHKPIDWRKVDRSLNKERKKSAEWLLRALQD